MNFPPVTRLAVPKNAKDAADIASAILRVHLQFTLYKLMSEKKKSQKDIADMLGVKPDTVYRILRNPTLRSAAKICFVLGEEIDVDIKLSKW